MAPGGPSPSAPWKLPKLRIDRDGEWYDDDVQVTHAGVLANLRSNLRRDANGYYIQTAVRIPVLVDDVPWVATRLERRDAGLHVVLNDGTEEDIDPASLRIGPGDVPYCSVKGGRFEARFARAAAFQLLAMVEPEADVLALGDRTYRLRRTA